MYDGNEKSSNGDDEIENNDFTEFYLLMFFLCFF